MKRSEYLAKIAGERCLCGHSKNMHKGIDGHGACLACGCLQFTFKHFIDRDGNELRSSDLE